MSQHTKTYLITCAAGLESSLLIELDTLGISDAHHETTGRIAADMTLKEFYTVCLWSRVASRVLLPLFSEPVKLMKGHEPDIAEQLFLAARDFDWSLVFDVDHTFVVKLNTDKKFSVNQQFATLRVKDAIVDSFVEATGSRPDVAKDAQHTIHVSVGKRMKDVKSTNQHDMSFYLDLTGTSLHRRGYRHAMTDAPLKENLAAALLYQADWHTNKYDAIFDPMCGSGTLLIEALLMWTDYAVGNDKDFGFTYWNQHDEALWDEVMADAESRFHAGLDKPMPKLIGYDAEINAIKATHKNLIAAGFEDHVNAFTLETRSLANWPADLSDKFEDSQPLIITNPPYGERLGEKDSNKALYKALGLNLQTHFPHEKFPNQQAAVVAAHVEIADVLPFDEPTTLKTHNGQLTIYLRQGTIKPNTAQPLIQQWEKQPVEFADAQDLVNRLQKNMLALRKLAKKQSVTNLRIYDADLPNYNLAIDLYGEYVHVQEYAAPKKIDPETAKRNFNTALQAIRLVLDVTRDKVFIKTRRKQKGKEQYEKSGSSGKFFTTSEAGARFYINLTDYLDTGLFLDHRPIRTRIQHEAKGKRVLNLYAYTCSASVHAAVGGASHVTSVDLSNTYLDWGRRNFALNGLVDDSEQYEFIYADVFEWLKGSPQDASEKYDLIFIDPPTFSNSKKFGGTFDVQRDHISLIKRAMNRLNNGGVMYFSNNYRGFELDESITNSFKVENITHETIGFDFQSKKNAGNKKIHQCWRIS